MPQLPQFCVNVLSYKYIKVFRVWPWLLTPEDHLGSKKFYYLKAHIWLPIWLLWTTSLYLVPFSRYSTSKFFRVWPWPLTPKGSSGVKTIYTVWKPIYDFLFDFLWTTSLYLVPFSRYSTSKFLGFDLDLWPLRIIWGQNNSYRSKSIYDFLFDFHGQHLSISYRFRDIRLQSF